jgi:hypothetical protein
MDSEHLQLSSTRTMIVSEMPVHLRRSKDDESGLALINLAA